METPEDHAFVALGANLPSDTGAPASTLQAAVEALAHLSTAPVQVSSFWYSDPVDCPPGSPRFVNAVAALRPPPLQTPRELLSQLQAIEQAFGRRRSAVVNEARPLDLDIVTFRGLTLETAQLTLPHPRAHKRAFVLAPLAELAPQLVLPGFSESVKVLLAELGYQGLEKL